MPCWGLGVRGHSHSRTLERGEKSLSRSRESCIILSIWNRSFLFWRKSHIPPTAWSTSHFSPYCLLTSLSPHEPDGIHWNFEAQIQKRRLWDAGKTDEQAALQGYIISRRLSASFHVLCGLCICIWDPPPAPPPGAAGLESRALDETNRVWQHGHKKCKRAVIWLGGAVTLKASTKPALLLSSPKFWNRWFHLDVFPFRSARRVIYKLSASLN